MKISKIHLISFSPCGHTLTYGRQMAQACANAAGQETFEELNITPHASGSSRTYTGSELVLLCAPVYGGRIPAAAIDRFKLLKAQNTPTILVTTYGNRHYDDALLEFVDFARSQGFWPVGACACVAQHTLAQECAAGRPSQLDLDSARDFATEAAATLLSDASRAGAKLIVPGNSPYKEYTPGALPQSVNDNCVMCGQCWINCPTGAIAAEEPPNVDATLCIACMGCINICPVGARIPAEQFLQKVAERLAPLCATPKANEYFHI